MLKNKKSLLIIFVVVVAVACSVKILLEYEWSLIGRALRNSNFRLFLIGSTASIVLYWVFRALRWQVLLKNDGISLPFWQIYLVTGISVGSSTITPFQSGEALKVEYLRKYGGKRLSGYTIFFLERLFDLFAVVSLAIIGISFGFDFGISQSYFYIFFAVLCGVLLIIIGSVFAFPLAILSPVRELLQEKWRQKRTLTLTAILTVFSWLAVVLGWKMALASVSIETTFLQAVSIVSITTLLAIISFVPGAVGVSEVSITAILTKMQIAIPLAQTGAIAIRAYALMIIALTVLHWIIFKLLSKKLSAGVIQ